ncbi:MAG: hypothetical protein HYR84_02970 [Planctomycetes bacterium]|nr:hypothetical protein [Planctomycetota bacterium]
MESKNLICAVIFGALAFGGPNSGGDKKPIELPAESRTVSPVQAKMGDDLAKLGKARLDAAEKAYRAYIKAIANERPFLITTYHLSLHWLNAELDLAQKKEQRIAAFGAHLVRMRGWEKEWEGSAAPEADLFLIIRPYQKEAEYWLAKEKAIKK